MLADEFILNLNKVELNNKNLLPEYLGIYYVVDADKVVWYIGRSVSLWKRWNGEQPHHRYHQLIAISKSQNKPFYIYYSETSKKKLYQLEIEQIYKYQPRLNNTPVISKRNTKHNLIPSLNTSKESSNISNTNKTLSLKILSNNYKPKNIIIKEDKTIKDNSVDIMTKNERAVVNTSLKQFERKFITLKNDETGLNLQLEICIDSRGRLFVRHYTFFIIYGDVIGVHTYIIDKNDKDTINDPLSTLESKCESLYRVSIKWLGYKLKCEDIILIDEKEDFQIETPAIMLPFNMFVDLVEYEWLSDSNLSEALEEKETSWYKEQSTLTKIAKWLHDRNTNLRKLVEEIE